MTYQITGTTVINSGCCLTNIVNACSTGTGIGASVFVIRDSSCNIQSSKITIVVGTPTKLGYGVVEGGYLICKAGGTAWIVAPISSEVSRTWANIADANTTAQQVSGCTGWFVPTWGQLQNPGYTCRTYWDSYSSTYYWSNTEHNAENVWSVEFGTGTTNLIIGKTNMVCVRAFRCVTY